MTVGSIWQWLKTYQQPFFSMNIHNFQLCWHQSHVLQRIDPGPEFCSLLPSLWERQVQKGSWLVEFVVGWVHTFKCVPVYVHVCMYIYLYIYICIHTYVYMCVCVQILSAIVHKSPNDLYNHHILSLYNSTIFSWCIGGFSSKNSLFDQMCDHLYIVWKSHMISTSNCLKNRYILHSMINLLIIMQTLWKQPHLGYMCTALSRQTDKPKKTWH